MDLFFQPEVRFEKTSAAVDLPEDPNQWSKEILDELYKQVPFIADFHPHVRMERVDAERAYGIGAVEVSNQSESQDGTDPQMLSAAGIRSIRIPIVIKDGKLSPFDLLINDAGKTLPLTEARLRQAIFRPQMFDVTGQSPGDQSMIGQLYPPYRSNMGFGGGGVNISAGGMGKLGSFEEFLMSDDKPKPQEKTASFKSVVNFQRTGSILEKVAHSLRKVDLDNLWAQVEGDVGLRAAIARNKEAMVRPLAILTKEPPVVKTAEALLDAIKPTVTQIVKTAGGYTVKTASHLFWQPVHQQVTRGELVERFGEKVALAVDTAGSGTVAEGADASEEQELPDQPITQAGTYALSTADGNQVVGVVIPNLLDLDGGPLPISLFTNGSQATVQSEILGRPATDGIALPEGPPQGYGAFFTYDGSGAKALLPMKLTASYSDPGEPVTLVGETYDGRPVEVSVQPNIQDVTPVADGRVIVPEGWKWTPLDRAAEVSLAGADQEAAQVEMPEEGGEMPEQAAEPKPKKKTASAYITVRSDGNSFSFSGPAVEKLAERDRSFLNLDDALFLLAGLGVEQGYGATKLAHTLMGGGSERVVVGRFLKLASDELAWANRRASDVLSNVPNLKRDLLKEATTIPDPMAVDTVLSLGFINDENLLTYASYLPTIDDAQMKMCEILLGARLGIMPDVSESAIERAIRSTEEVIEGLRVVAFQGNS